jgi:hypothetical protein
MKRSVIRAAVAAYLLHALAAAWAWSRWGRLGRGTVITWVDFPSSLLFLDRTDHAFLLASLLLGGLQWTLVAALLTWSLGRAMRRE